MDNVFAIVLNYNCANDTKKCVSFLQKQNYGNLQIVVVDNNSNDEDCQKLKEIEQSEDSSCLITILRSKRNGGYSAGNNIGLRYAQKNGAKWCLIINPDVELRDKDYIHKIMAFKDEVPNAVVIGSNVLLPDGQKQNPMRESSYGEELLWPLESIGRKIKGKNSYLAVDKSGYCDKVSGCCFFIRVDFLMKIDFLDENVFLYCEEPILASSVRQHGYCEAYYNGTTAFHMHVENTKGNYKKRLQQFRKSRRYYWGKYSGYSGIKLKLLLFSDKLYCRIKLGEDKRR